jgi:hypothetical protein
VKLALAQTGILLLLNSRDTILHLVKNQACYKPGIVFPEYDEDLHNSWFCLIVCSLSSRRLSGINTAASGANKFKHEACSSEELFVLFTHDAFSVIMGNAACISRGSTYGRPFLPI